jgi:hypothetical protein
MLREGRLELTEQAESRLHKQPHRERADRLEAALEEERSKVRGALEAERSKGFWSRLFGGWPHPRTTFRSHIRSF